MRSAKFMYMDTGEDKVGSRSSRNSRLYKQLSGGGDLDNLPLDENTTEINMSDLKRMVSSDYDNNRVNRERPVMDVRHNYKDDSQKIYDINKLLEQAKYENNKIKELDDDRMKSKQILETLESKELSLEDIKAACKRYEEMLAKEKNVEDQHDLTMTREMKYKDRQLQEEEDSKDDKIEKEVNSETTSTDLFADLKATGDTIVTKPIVSEISGSATDIHSDDTTDIDVIKKEEDNTRQFNNDAPFFTNPYKFSKKDFQNDDEFMDDYKPHNKLMIFFLIVAIIAIGFVIYYFVMNYGLGIQ